MATTTKANATANPSSSAAAAATASEGGGDSMGNPVKRTTSPSEILMIYGLILMVSGALAFHASGYKPAAKSSLYMGNGGAVVAFILAAGSRKVHLKKGESGYILMMISIHLALIYPLIMTGVVSWRLSLAWSVPTKAYVRPYLMAIIAGSLATFALLSCFKPKKTKSKNDDDDNVSQFTSESSSSSSITRQIQRNEDQQQQGQNRKDLKQRRNKNTNASDGDSDILANGGSPVSDTENGSLSGNAGLGGNDGTATATTGGVNAHDGSTSGNAIHAQSRSHRHGSKSSSGDKAHKPPVVRRRPRRAQAM